MRTESTGKTGILAGRAAAACLIAAAVAVASGCATSQGGGSFAFGVIGDIPYTRAQEREYRNVLQSLNAADLAFVVHVGDFQFDARPYNQNPALASIP